MRGPRNPLTSFVKPARLTSFNRIEELSGEFMISEVLRYDLIG